MIAFTLTSTYWLWLVGGLYLAGPALIAIGVVLKPAAASDDEAQVPA